MKNVKPDEIDHFSKLGSRFWDEEGELWTLHKINPLRLGFIQKHVELEGKSGIDVGCGGGVLTEALAKSGANMIGIDMAEGALEAGELHALETKVDVKYECIRAEDMAEKHPEGFDFVTCMEMLEHVPEPKAVVEACVKMLKPGGKIFFSTLNRNLKTFLTAIVGAEYILNMIPRGTHTYSMLIKPDEIIAWCREFGLTPLDSTGIDYNPFNKSFKLKKGLDVNYILVFEKG